DLATVLDTRPRALVGRALRPRAGRGLRPRMAPRADARRRSLARDRRSPRRHGVAGDGRARDALAPAQRLAASSQGLLGPDALARALGQPRELPPALPEGRPRRAAAGHHALLDAAAAALSPRQPVGRDPGAGRPDAARGEQEAGPRARSLRGGGDGGARGGATGPRVDRRGARPPHGPGRGAPPEAPAREGSSIAIASRLPVAPARGDGASPRRTRCPGGSAAAPPS